MSQKTVLMMENIMDAEGDPARYASIARKSREDYRTLNEFFAEKLKGSTKQLLAKKLGVSVHTINNWEKNGIPSMKQAVCIALALGLDLEETNFFFRKYAGMGTLYPADRVHAKYIYMLVFRARLEQRFPYAPEETAEDWMDRVWAGIGGPKAPSRSKGQDDDAKEGPRVATEVFMEAIMGEDMDAVKALPFRSAGKKACDYLREYVKGSPFEKYYGNRSHTDAVSGKSVRNSRLLLDRYHEEERAQYSNMVEKLENGTFVHRDELLAMAMLLRMTREQADELLEKSGKNPISARNLYEGALLMVWSFLSEVCPAWFGFEGINTIQCDEKLTLELEEMLAADYEAEIYTGGPVDLGVTFSRRIDQALALLPKGLKPQLREVPGWYLTEAERAKRMEKRRFSDILSECAEQLCGIWRSRAERGAKARQWSLAGSVNDMLSDGGWETLDGGKDDAVLEMLKNIEVRWLEILAAKPGLGKTEAERLCLETLSELDEYYIKNYAPKKRKGGTGGGQKAAE